MVALRWMGEGVAGDVDEVRACARIRRDRREIFHFEIAGLLAKSR